MAKVTGPAFSVDAHGELGGGICFTGCKSGHRVILSPQPGNPNSASQSAHRASFHSAKSAWKLLSPASKAALNVEADLLHMTGYNLYIKRVLLGQQAIGEWHEGSLNRQPAANLDDCDMILDGAGPWIIDTAYSRQRAGNETGAFLKMGGGMRFSNITILQGATILTAYIEFTACYDRSGAGMKSRIIGDNEDDAGAWSNETDYQARRGTDCDGPDNTKRTVAQVTWDDLATWALNTKYNTPDLSAIIQEIVNRPGWVSGNHLALFWDDHEGRTAEGVERIAYSRNWSPGGSAKLYVTYKWFV